jgi:hypothetical protein
MPRIATTVITSWQTALKWTADCQALRLGCQEYIRSGQACGNPLSNLDSLTVAFRVMAILFVAIRALKAVDCHNLQDTFECGARD